MAINTQKFLPVSKGIGKSLATAKISSITLTSQDKKSVNTIRVRTIQIDKILKGTLAADKKRLNDKKKEASQQRKEDIETKLEKKPDLKKNIKIPNILPKTGILDWIKNFISNIILGYFAVRLIKYLPQLSSLFTGIVAAGEFIIDWGGKILNGLVTFLDEAYKLYDGIREFTGDIFGEDGVKKFDNLMGNLNKVLNGTFLLAMAMSKVGGGKPGKPGTSGKPGGGRGTRTASGGRTLGRPGIRNPFRARPNITGTASKRLAAKVIKPLVNKIPLIGGLLEFAISWALGDPVGKAAFRGIGSLLLGTIGTVVGGPIGAVLGTWAGGEGGAVLYDMIFSNKKPSPGKVPGHKGGGKVKNKKAPKARRVLTSRRTSTAKKVITPPNINPVKIDPGKDISGTEEIKVEPGKTEVKSKIFGVFPNPWANLPKDKQPPDASPLDFIKKYGDKFGEMKYFGPMSALAVKALVGQRPSNDEYDNAAKGLTSLLRADATMGFAGGGSVYRRREKELSDKISKELKKTMEPIVNSTISDIQKAAGISIPISKDRSSSIDSGTSSIDSGSGAHKGWTSGTAGGLWGPILDLIGSVEGTYESVYPNSKIPGLTEMTIREAFNASENWRAKHGGTGAFGRYQLVSDPIGRAKAAGLDPEKDLFSPENQDKIAITIITSPRYRGIDLDMLTNNPTKAQLLLAKEWAGLPKDSSNRGYYDGDGKNAAGTTTAKVREAFKKVVGGGSGNRTIERIQGVAPGKEGDIKEQASMSPGKAKQIYLHWTAGGYDSVVGPYHSIFTGDGKMHRRVDYNTRSSHTYGRNTNSIGLSVAAMAGGPGNYQWPTNKQLDSMAAEAARLAKSWGWTKNDITIKNIMTHGEAASNKDGRNMHDNYGPTDWGGTGERWDLDRLGPDDAIGDGGNKMRDRIKAKMWRGGFTKSGAHTALLGERGREFVMDADSTAAMEDAFPGLLSKLNREKYAGTIKTLTSYAEYEMGAGDSVDVEQQLVTVPVHVASKSTGGGGPFIGGGGHDPFSVLGLNA